MGEVQSTHIVRQRRWTRPRVAIPVIDLALAEGAVASLASSLGIGLEGLARLSSRRAATAKQPDGVTPAGAPGAHAGALPQSGRGWRSLDDIVTVTAITTRTAHSKALIVRGTGYYVDCLSQVTAILEAGVMWEPSDHAEAETLFYYRGRLAATPALLPKFLLCVDWRSAEQTNIALGMMSCWSALGAHDALLLLDARYQHAPVRIFAAHTCGALLDDELDEVCIKLVKGTIPKLLPVVVHTIRCPP